MIQQSVLDHVNALLRESDDELLNYIRLAAREEYKRRGGLMIEFGPKEQP